MAELIYAQARPKRQLHLVETYGASVSDVALCGRGPTREDGQWRMTINVPLDHACQDCLRVLRGPVCKKGHPLPEGARRVNSEGKLRCRTCSAEAQRRYQAKHGDAARAKRRERERQYRAAYPEKVRAHGAVQNALLNGSLVRPDACEECGGPNPQAAHHDYKRQLDVRWLCATCHSRWDWSRRGTRYV